MNRNSELGSSPGASQKYFFKNAADEVEHGPVGLAEISTRIKDGSITSMTRVRSSGFLVWNYIDQFPELAALFIPARAKPPSGIEQTRLSDLTVGDLPRLAWFSTQRILPWLILIFACLTSLEAINIFMVFSLQKELIRRVLGSSFITYPFDLWPGVFCLLWLFLMPIAIWVLHRKQKISFNTFIFSEIGAYLLPIIFVWIWIWQIGASFADIFRIPMGSFGVSMRP